MAAQAWTVYGTAKLKLGAGTFDLPGTMRIGLYKSSSNFATFSTLSTESVVTNEVDTGNGYTASGKPLVNGSWVTGASSLQIKFDADDIVWTATGGNIDSIKAAVIFNGTATAANRHLLCAASLTSAEFTLSSGNTLTIQMNASGILTLT